MARQSSRTAEMVANAEDADIIGTNTRADNAMIPVDDIDTEESWDSWIDSLKSSEATGTVRVYKLPLDIEGNPTMTKGAKQILLLTCPHQQYDFDDLILMVKNKFMQPGELATIRILGTRSGHRGVMFNRTISIQREAGASPGIGGEGNANMLGVIQAMQAQSRQQSEMLERIMSGNRVGELAPPKPASDSVREWLTILSPIFAPALLALINRPQPKSDLEGLIGAMVKLKDLTGGDGGGGDSDENTTLGIVKAVAGPGLQLLNTLAQNRTNFAPQPNAPRRVRQMIPGAAQLNGAPNQPPPVNLPPAQPTNAAPSAPPASPENDPMLAQLAPQLEQLATLAEQGADPAEVSKLVMDMLPSNDSMDEQLFSIVSDPAAFARLALLAPKMKAHSEWFERLRLAMLAEFEGPSEQIQAG